MRPIDADVLTEIVQGMYAEGDDSNSYHVDVEGDTLIGKFAVIDTIFNMPTIQPEPHWIPCSERLPKAKQKVLVQYADESMATKRCNDAGHLAWFYSNAVAWMPAPEPYKGVTE